MVEFGEPKIGTVHWVSAGVFLQITAAGKNDIHDPKATCVIASFCVNENLLNHEERLGKMLEKINMFAELFPKLRGKRYYYRPRGDFRHQTPIISGRMERFEIK